MGEAGEAQGSTPETGPASWKSWAIGIAAVLALSYGCGAMLTDSGGGNDDAQTNDLTAFNSCKDFVRDQLKAPSTATFRNFFEADGEVTVTNSGDTYTVRSSVDSENSFGASLRSDFTCIVTMDGTTIRLVDIDLRER